MLRLRQVCLVAHRLEPVVTDLADVLGLQVAHRDPAVAMFGLENAVLPIGDAFIEVVAPIADGTAAGRFLDRRGPGGYMVILDTDDLAPWPTRLADRGIRIAADLAAEGYRGLQLHPRDTGGPLLEINWSAGWEAGAYHPAGGDWRACVSTERCAGLAEVVIESAEPDALARNWGAMLGRAVGQAPGPTIALDRGVVRFAVGRNDAGRLVGITVGTADPDVIRRAAVERHCPIGTDFVDIGGIRIRLAAADAGSFPA